MVTSGKLYKVSVYVPKGHSKDLNLIFQGRILGIVDIFLYDHSTRETLPYHVAEEIVTASEVSILLHNIGLGICPCIISVDTPEDTKVKYLYTFTDEGIQVALADTSGRSELLNEQDYKNFQLFKLNQIIEV